VTGNKGETKKLEFIPIRQACITEIKYDDTTDYYHVYFQLGEFVSSSDFSIDDFPESPLNKIFLGHQIVQPKFNGKAQWIDVVRRLFQYKRILFFSVQVIDQEQKPVAPFSEKGTHSAYFPLKENKDYWIKISIADFNEDKEQHEIRTSVKASDLSTNLASTINSGLEIDQEFYKLSGLTIGDQSTKVNLIKLASCKTVQPSGEISNYSVRLLFEVRRNKWRWAKYFLYSIVFYLGAAIVAADFFKIYESWMVFVKGVGLILVSAATATLYFQFNKK
jgi:hypothetical protein